MLKSLISYAATRVAVDAVDSIARRAVWGSVAAVLFLTSFVLAIMIAFWTFEPIYGAVLTAAGIAAGCILFAGLALIVPALLEWSRNSAVAAKVEDSSIANVATAVEEETEAAVDYFGALQVVASAFMFGLGAARQLRSR